MTLQSSTPKSNSLSSYEVQALIGFPSFKNLERQEVASALAKILHTSAENLFRMTALGGSDTQNVSVCLLSHLNEWADGLEVGATPNGGQQQMRNVRICELASGKSDRGGRKKDKTGTPLPCLEDFGLSICCAMISGTQGRMWSYFRICHADEVRRRDGKKIPYKPPIKKGSTDRKKRVESAPAPRESSLTPIGVNPSAPAQAAMFDAFLSHETGAVHGKGRRA